MNVCCMAGGHHHPLTEHVSVFLHSWCGHATLPPPLPIATVKWPKRTYFFDFLNFAKWPKQALCPLQPPSAQTHYTVHYGYNTFLLNASIFWSGVQASAFFACIQASVFFQASRPPLFLSGIQASGIRFFACIQASPFQGWGD